MYDRITKDDVGRKFKDKKGRFWKIISVKDKPINYPVEITLCDDPSRVEWLARNGLYNNDGLSSDFDFHEWVVEEKEQADDDPLTALVKNLVVQMVDGVQSEIREQLKDLDLTKITIDDLKGGDEMNTSFEIKDDYLLEINAKTPTKTNIEHKWFDSLEIARAFVRSLDIGGCSLGLQIDEMELSNVGDYITINKKLDFMGVSFGSIKIILTKMR